MRGGKLHDYFVGAGIKRLTAVDAESRRSNQHEVGTTQAMRLHFLGEVQHQRFRTMYVWLGDEQGGFTAEGTATHYDTRALKAHRAPEWRLYYHSNPVTEAMRERDILLLAMTIDGLLYFIVAPEGSTSESQLSWLFGLQPKGRSFVSREVRDDKLDLDIAARFIFEEIGIEFEEPNAAELDTIIEPFGTMFPTTAEFSDLARLTLPEVRAEDDPDKALVAWLNREEALFRRLERRIVTTRLNDGFWDNCGATDVDGFIRFSLSVQNRRKSRMGYSLENHLEAIFCAYNVSYVRGAVTENNQRPDFLFPSEIAYRTAPHTGHSWLTMLGVKSSCKDRWRQVLAEASKISRKHLLTLEPGISKSQTGQMANSNLQLVVPRSIQGTYSNDQRAWLWNVCDFIREIRARAYHRSATV